MLVTLNGKPQPAQDFELILPEQLTPEPTWSVKLPYGNTALVFRYIWKVPAVAGVPPHEADGYRIEYVGPDVSHWQGYEKIRDVHHVSDALVEATRKLLDHAARGTKDEDDDDFPQTKAPAAPKKRMYRTP